MKAAIVSFESPNHKISGKIVEAAKCRRLCDVQIIADENSCSTPARKKIPKMRDNQTCAAVEQEGDGNIASRRLVEMQQQVRQ